MEEKAQDIFDESALLDKLHQVVGEKKLNSRTEQTYRHWILKFISFTSMKKNNGGKDGRARHEANEEQVNRFLGHLKVRLQLSKARMNQARRALEFYFAYIVEKPLNH